MHLRQQFKATCFWRKIYKATLWIIVLVSILVGCNSQQGAEQSNLTNQTIPTNQTLSYTVTFKDWNGAVIKTETVEFGKAATAPEHPFRVGHKFADWDQAYDNVTSDLTVTATYSAITTPTIAVDNVSVSNTAEPVEVAVRVFNNPGIASLKFIVAYPSYLTLDNVALNSGFGSYITTPTPYSNPQMITMINPMANLNENGVLATLIFRFSGEVTEDTADITIRLSENELFDVDFNLVKFEHLNGGITILND